MATILVHTAFWLTKTPSDRKRFEVGLHRNVPADEADHWYTLEHATKVSDADDAPAPDPSSEPLTDNKRESIISRLTYLYRQQLAPLSDEQLVDALKHAEGHSLAIEKRAADAAENAGETEGVPQGQDGVSPVDIAENSGDSDDAEDAGPELSDAELVEAMTPEELRQYITDKTGKAPHHKLSDENLLKAAKEIAEGDKTDEPPAHTEEAV